MVKWWFIIGVGAWYAYQRVNSGEAIGSGAALIFVGCFLYASIYGVAAILTMLYIFIVLPRRDPERFEALRQTGAQALIRPDSKGIIWGVIALLFLVSL
jgi:hypothetical protein